MIPDPGGGESPLLVLAFGSGVEASAPAGAEVAPSDCVTGVEPTTAPVEALDPVPAVAATALADPAPGPSLVWPDGEEDVEVSVPVGSVAFAVSGALTEVEAVASVEVEAMTVVTVPVVVSVGADTDVLSDAPTIAVSTGGAGGDDARSELPGEIVPDGGGETVEESDDEICVSVDVESELSVGLGVVASSTTARERDVWAVFETAGASPVFVAGAGVGAVDVAGGAGAAGVVGAAAGAGVAGSCTGTPTESDTLGVDRKGSAGALVGATPAAPTSE
jgi:hypothetical protein